MTADLHHQILASDVDFWQFGLDSMKLRHSTCIYPPRVKLTIVLCSEDIVKVPIKFVGCLADNQLDIELALPIGMK